MSTRAAEREAELKRKRNEKRHRKRSTRNDAIDKLSSTSPSQVEDTTADDYEIEYIPEPMSSEYEDLMLKFVPVPEDEDVQLPPDGYSHEMSDILLADAERKALEAASATMLDSDIKLSNRAQRLASRISLAELKRAVERPDLVDGMDNCSPDPTLLLFCKSYRNAVQVPRHWSNKRNYLANKRGVDKFAFKLPEYIEQTGIAKIRQALIAKEAERDIKAKQRAKMRPKTGKLDIDYQVLHDAFFKFQTKPAHMTKHGDIYYEGREAETRYAHKRPGQITPLLREALGMIEGSPPPWLINMQRFGPPPSYPHLKIPGLNAPIPVGCEWGYHPGGWGKPPLDEYGNPLYGGLWNPDNDRAAIVDLGELQARKDLWGEFVDEESEDEEEEVTDVTTTVKPPVTTPAIPQFGQGVAVALSPPVPSISVPAGPSSVAVPAGELYRILQQKAAPSQAGALFPSRNVYELNIEASADATGGIATAAGISKRAHDVEDDNVLSVEMIRKQLAEHENAAAAKPEKKKKKEKFKF